MPHSFLTASVGGELSAGCLRHLVMLERRRHSFWSCSEKRELIPHVPPSGKSLISSNHFRENMRQPLPHRLISIQNLLRVWILSFEWLLRWKLESFIQCFFLVSLHNPFGYSGVFDSFFNKLDYSLWRDWTWELCYQEINFWNLLPDTFVIRDHLQIPS